MLELFNIVIKHVLTALYQPFGFSVLLSVLFMFLYLYAKEHGWKEVYQRWCKSFKNDMNFRRIFFLVFYTTMILFRTLLNRDMWTNPLSDVIGVWGIYNKNGELTTEVIENLMLFIPFSVLLMYSLKSKILGQYRGLKWIFWKSVKVVFLFSVVIEFLQLFLRVGTFQLSDLFYNTLGGLIGGLIYWCGCQIKKKEDKICDKSKSK